MKFPAFSLQSSAPTANLAATTLKTKN